VNEYSPLSHRVLKEIDKLKHLAEKKRLLYVALTRAESDVVVSATLKQKEDRAISLRKDSYLHMICESLEIDKDELYGQNRHYCIEVADTSTENIANTEIEYTQHTLKPIIFTSNNAVSATADTKRTSSDSSAADLGTATHKIIELYWESFRENQEAILDKMMIFEEKQRVSIIKNMDTFYNSDIYRLLNNGVQHHFELEFNVDDKTGFIDFIYFDKKSDGWVIIDFKTGVETPEKSSKYQEQLDFYTEVMTKLEHKIVDARLLWLS